MVDDRSVIRWTAAQVARAVMPWTIGHVPTITLPVFRGPSGMPVGLQVLARRFHDRRLFALAQRVYEMRPAWIMSSASPLLPTGYHGRTDEHH